MILFRMFSGIALIVKSLFSRNGETIGDLVRDGAQKAHRLNRAGNGFFIP